MQQSSVISKTNEHDCPRLIVGEIPVELDIKNEERYLFISKEQRAYTHAIHKYPAKFFPELPRWVIKRYSKQDDLILDPFMGSGTTNLEAMLLNRNSVGVDIDPFSRFLSRVKTTPLRTSELLQAIQNIESYLSSFTSSNQRIKLPEFPYRDNWFKPCVLHELAFLKAGIDKLNCSQQTRNFLLITFSSIVRQTSQADNNCTRTVIRKKLKKKVVSGYAFQLFQKRLNSNASGMLKLSKQNLAKVDIPDNASAKNLSMYPREFFDLAVTSPPYVNAVDYPRTHQLEMYWLGLAAGSLRNLKRQHIGTEVVNSREYSTLQKTGVDGADAIIHSIFQVDKRRAFIAAKYIQDMIINLKEVFKVLKPNGRYVIVVGNNMIRGHRFENWRYLEEAAITLGYTVECRFISEIINHFIKIPRKERINHDHVLILRK